MHTNDERCDDNRYEARGFYSSAMADMNYLPLGPRYDSWHAISSFIIENGSVIAASSQRKYTFNAIFTKSTNIGRSILDDEIQKEGNNLSSFVHITDTWAHDPNNPANDLIDTTTYMQGLVYSVFTCCP